MFPSRSKLPFTTDGAADSHTVAEQSSPLWQNVADDSHTVAEQSSPLRRGGTKCRGGLSPETSAKGERRVTSNFLVIAKEYDQR